MLIFPVFLSTVISKKKNQTKKQLKTSGWSCLKGFLRIYKTRLCRGFKLFCLKMRIDRKTVKKGFIRFFWATRYLLALPRYQWYLKGQSTDGPIDTLTYRSPSTLQNEFRRDPLLKIIHTPLNRGIDDKTKTLKKYFIWGTKYYEIFVLWLKKYPI